MYGRLMLTKLGYIDGKCYHIYHTWILWDIYIYAYHGEELFFLA